MSRVTSRKRACRMYMVHVIKQPRSTMATEASLVKSTFKTVLEENELQLSSPRCDNLKRAGKQILELIKREVRQTFIEFSTRITAAVRSILPSSTTYCSSATKREKSWSAFHQLRLSELPKLWKVFLPLKLVMMTSCCNNL